MAKTEKEWKELGSQIAQKIMGWYTWGDLPPEARDAILADEDAQWRTAQEEMHRMMWWEACEKWPHGFWWVSADLRPEDWPPHKNVVQAGPALAALAHGGGQSGSTRFTQREGAGQLWGYLGGAFCVRRRTGEIVRETICLATEAWLDAE